MKNLFLIMALTSFLSHAEIPKVHKEAGEKTSKALLAGAGVELGLALRNDFLQDKIDKYQSLYSIRDQVNKYLDNSHLGNNKRILKNRLSELQEDMKYAKAAKIVRLKADAKLALNELDIIMNEYKKKSDEITATVFKKLRGVSIKGKGVRIEIVQEIEDGLNKEKIKNTGKLKRTIGGMIGTAVITGGYVVYIALDDITKKEGERAKTDSFSVSNSRDIKTMKIEPLFETISSSKSNKSK